MMEVLFTRTSPEPPGLRSLCPQPAPSAAPVPFLLAPGPAEGGQGLRLLHLSQPSSPACRGLGFLLSGSGKGLCHMLFTCGQFLFGFRGCLLAMSKQPLPEPSGEFRSFHLGLGSRFVVPCLGAKSGRDFSRNTISQKNWSKTAEGIGDNREERREKREKS